MRVLLVSPDYASHYLPLSALGQALVARGHEVTVATGPALATRVQRDGLDHRELVLGPGSNPGLIRTEAQPADEREHLEAFLEATRRGLVATLRHQAESRLHDLLWQPEAVTERLGEILAEVRPDQVVSDQLAFGATLALRALEAPWVSFHPGHPSALPGPGELFGFPAHRPRELPAAPEELAALWDLCADVSARFTQRFNSALRALNPAAEEVPSALAATSPLLTLLNYPAQVGGYRRPLLPVTARFVGASVRDEPVSEDATHDLFARSEGRLPRVYVSLGSFLSSRADVLGRIVTAFREEPVELVVASGVTPPRQLGAVPSGWFVRSYVPQPQILRRCDLVVCHGGNNTVTEALWAGVPLLVGPLSSDQFAAAEDVRSAGLGDVFDPNATPPVEIAARAQAILQSSAPRRAAALGATLRQKRGAPFAAALLERVDGPGDRRPPRPAGTARTPLRRIAAPERRPHFPLDAA